MQNGKAEQPVRTRTQKACFVRATQGGGEGGGGLLSITTPVSLLASEFDVRSVVHGLVSFAAVN